MANENFAVTLADSLPTVIQSARIVREFAGVMPRLVDRRRLGTGEGLNWNEVALSQLVAQDLGNQQRNENFQLLEDTKFSVSESLVGLSIKITDHGRRRWSQNVASLVGDLGQRAMNTKKDKNLLAIGSSATTDLGTAGNPMTSTLVGGAVTRVKSNRTEPGTEFPVYLVGTGPHMHDIDEELVGGVGTYPVPAGLTADVFRNGFAGSIRRAEAFIDDNLTVDAAEDAIAMVFAGGSGGAIVHVEESTPRAVTVRDEGLADGADVMYMTDRYATGIRQQVHIYAITADSQQPS